MLGLPGLYAVQAERAGVLGLVGTVAVFFCVALLDGTHDVIHSMVRPALATLPEAAPLLHKGREGTPREGVPCVSFLLQSFLLDAYSLHDQAPRLRT